MEAPKDGTGIMPHYFHITTAANDRFVWSSSGIDTHESPDFRSSYEAIDDLRRHISWEGLIVPKGTPFGPGSVVTAYTPEEFAKLPMLFSGSAARRLEELKTRLDRQLRELALKRARDDHRTLIDADDVQAIANEFGGSLLED